MSSINRVLRNLAATKEQGSHHQVTEENEMMNMNMNMNMMLWPGDAGQCVRQAADVQRAGGELGVVRSHALRPPPGQALIENSPPKLGPETAANRRGKNRCRMHALSM